MELKQRQMISETLRRKGIKPPSRKGITMTDKQKEKISNSLRATLSKKPIKRPKCTDCDKYIYYESKKCWDCHKKNHPNKGENSKWWKGGISHQKGYTSHIVKIRRARKKGNGGSHAIEEWESLKRFYNFSCACCKQREPKIRLTQDHIVPLFLGGTHDIKNIQPLCRSCNSKNGITVKLYEK